MNDIACESLWFFTAIKLVYDNIWLSFLIFELQFFHDLLSEDSFERDYGTHQTKVPLSSTGQGNEWKELTFFMNNVYSYGSFDTLTFANKNVITY